VRPALTASNIHYKIAERTRANAHGGIGAIHLLVQHLELDHAIDRHLGLLKIHLPYHDSDHVLNVAYNLLAQLKGDVRSLVAPVDNLLSNWAYMVMGSLAWSLNAWTALVLPEEGRWQGRHREEKRKLLRMDFTTFRHAMMRVPAQILSTGRKIVYRFLTWNPWQHVFFRLLDQVRQPLRCRGHHLEAGVRMLRSVFTLNRTECSRVRHET